MNLEEYISKMKKIEENLLNFLDNEDNQEENFENFFKTINDENILNNQYDLKIFLYLINKISKNHHRYRNFSDKIDQILQKMKEKIKLYYTNIEIFEIFKTNKRILLFLIEEEIFIIDQYVYKEMNEEKFINMRYPEFFAPEINDFLIEKQIQSNLIQTTNKNQDNIENFNTKRKKGENDGYLCNIIQNDLIEEFIIYINKELYSLESLVDDSIFETNDFLLKQNQTSLIEYAAFFGSNQIFKYLYLNGAKLTNNLWFYAIHGCDEEIIHLLEENLTLPFYLFEQILKESIKCHHSFITNYIEENLIESVENTINNSFYCMKYFNFIQFDSKKLYNNDYNLFLVACKYDYYKIAEYLLNTKNIDINNYYVFNLF